MAAVQRTTAVGWTGTIARGTGRARGGSGALGNLPITAAVAVREPKGKTSPKELIAAAHAAAVDQAAQQAQRSCPVSRALQRHVAIAVHASLEGPPASPGISAA